ncbi:MAG: hypothetical protein OXQ92_07995 [Boseongicola sp.]|nr:hypothetical protein [Boseongicola sp.]MDD9976142.1 hypothetical protein [Boseongicola sp.]
MFGLFKKSEPKGPEFEHWIVAQLNARVQPIDRGEYFEDPLNDAMQASGLGEVTGGGTMMAGDPDGIEFVDVEVNVSAIDDQTKSKIIEVLERQGAPIGSKLKIDGEDDVPFGKLEGLGIYLNGTDLPDEVYENSDTDELVETLDKMMGDAGDFRGFWHGNLETALYFYGPSFDDMLSRVKAHLDSDPACEKSRLVRIA